MRPMKKLFVLLGFVLATLALSSCTLFNIYQIDPDAKPLPPVLPETRKRDADSSAVPSAGEPEPIVERIVVTRWDNYGLLSELRIRQEIIDANGSYRLAFYQNEASHGVYPLDEGQLLYAVSVNIPLLYSESEPPFRFASLEAEMRQSGFFQLPEDMKLMGMDGWMSYITAVYSDGSVCTRGGFCADEMGDLSYRELYKSYMKQFAVLRSLLSTPD